MSTASKKATSEWISLTPDLRAWLARPAGADNAPGLCIYIEAFGVNEHMRNVANRFAQAGYLAVIPDIYHGETFDYSDLDSALGAIRKLDEGRVIKETEQALDRLAEEGATGAPAVVGYCLGGRLAFRAGLELGARLSAVVSYYGGGIAPEQDRFGREPLAGRAGDMGAPILLHYGSEDQSIAPEEHGRIATALSKARKRHVISVYPGAGHGFDCNARASYHPVAAKEAWGLTLHFLETQRQS